MDEKELKIAALQEQLAQRVSEYEGRVADLRVANTLLNQRNQQLEQQQSEQSADSNETVKGEVVN